MMTRNKLHLRIQQLGLPGFLVGVLLSGFTALATTPVAFAQAIVAEPALEEVIVTARKRDETVQDVPATISVLDSDLIDSLNITRVQDFEYQVPGLVFGNRGFDGALIGIRGVSSFRGFTGDQAAVAVHMDGIYLPQSGQALGRMFDIERVEILKGPQGSLYGRNAVSGVINLISRAPGDEFGGYTKIGYGSRNTFTGEAALNVPIAEGQALRFSIAGADGDGYVHNVLDNRTFGNNDYIAGRLSYAGNWDNVTVSGIVQQNHDTSTTARQPARLNDPSSSTEGIYFDQTAINTEESYDRNDTLVGLQIDVDFDDIVFRSVTGYSKYKLDQVSDAEMDLNPTPVNPFLGYQESTAWSQEFNLFSSDGKVWDWRTGAYFMSEKVIETRFNDNTTSEYANFFSDYDDFYLKQTGDSWALFGTLDFHLSDAWDLSVGGRYNDETKKQLQQEVWGIVYTPVPPIPNCDATGGGALNCYSEDEKKFNWSAWSGDFSLTWDVSDSTNLYTRWATGFRSGAIGGVIGLENGLDQLFYGPGTLELTKLDPEKLNSIEFGSKSLLLDDRLSFNFAGFYNVYKDQLTFIFDPQTFRFIEDNVGKSEYYGAEVSGNWLLSEAWSVDFGALWMHSEITDLGELATGAVEGNKPIYSPTFSSALGINYFTPIGTGALSLRAEYNYKSSLYFDLANKIGEDAVGLLNLSARYDFKDDTWYLYAFVRNLTDERYLSNSTRTDLAAGPGPGNANPADPRTYEFGVGFNF
ncbi:MAG: TonB-dependent receptor [Xanthomonadales bacterium]|nr:TonB-dependent receptor [Xanthomonadales bacterium]